MTATAQRKCALGDDRVVARTLLKAGIIVTMDEAVPDLGHGDLLIENDRIAAIGPSIDAGDAEIIDAANRIVMPGFVNAHIHTWQSALKGVAADWAIPEYLHNMHARIAPAFRPEDIRTSNLMGALGQIDAGVTTIVDWCHNNPTPAHTDAAVEGLATSGIRALFLHGSPKPDPKPGQKHFSEIPHPRGEIERLARGPFASRDNLLTLGMAILGPHYATDDVATADFALARELGLPCSMHVGGGMAKTPDGFPRLIAKQLVGPNINIVHGNTMPEDVIAALVQAGASFTVTAESELQMGFSHPVTGRVRALGSAVSIGTDVESAMGSDPFTNMRVTLQYQRARDNQPTVDRTGHAPDRLDLPAREALHWATLAGARMAGLERRIGSLTPGKQADIVLLRADDLNLLPMSDPIASIVMFAHAGNVDSVFVAGKAVKRGGRLLHPDLAHHKAALAAVGRRILAEPARMH